jgi:phenylacetic acid degradation operon negative regulatory protein
MLFTLFGDYIRHYGGTIWVGSLIALMAELGFTAAGVRAAVSRMSRQGWLFPIRSGRSSYYALTPRGVDRIEEAAQRIFKLHPEAWDGRWRLLLVRFTSSNRERRSALRRELVWMGCAPISRGVYVTPNDIADRVGPVAERYGRGAAIEIFETRHGGPSAEGDLAGRYWDLAAIDTAYAEFVATWRPRLEMRRRPLDSGELLDDAAAFREKTLLVHAFRKFLFIDPGLPQDLLPPSWSGTAARAVFSGYYHILAEGALRYFEAQYRPAPGRERDLADGRQAARRDPFRPSLAVG